LSKRADDWDETLTSADESELDPLQWRDAADHDATSNALELDDDDDAAAADWNKDVDRVDSASPAMSLHKHGSSRLRCIIVALFVVLVIAGVCAAILLLHRRMQGPAAAAASAAAAAAAARYVQCSSHISAACDA